MIKNIENVKKPLSEIRKDIAKGKLPGATRIEGNYQKHFEQPHIHFSRGALNIDGTWKRGGFSLTNRQKDYLDNVGWGLPKE
ncbi:hypothetical protein SH611_08065 [Geminicoccaceae bacterium 1502E]|nr:hypothetical protein [Geminicoccaceae bacterium 1502E]